MICHDNFFNCFPAHNIKMRIRLSRLFWGHYQVTSVFNQRDMLVNWVYSQILISAKAFALQSSFKILEKFCNFLISHRREASRRRNSKYFFLR